MTISIGVMPVSGDGAVLVTDSLVQLRKPGGVQALLSMTPRFDQLPGANGALIVSAMTRGEWAVLSQAKGIEAAAEELLADLKANLCPNPWRFTDGTSVAAAGGFVAAGLDSDGKVRLAFYSTDRPAQWAPEGGAIFVGGAAAEWALTSELAKAPPPTTLAGAHSCAMSMAGSVIRTLYWSQDKQHLQDYLDVGEVPPFAPPYWMATVTADGIDIKRFSE